MIKKKKKRYLFTIKTVAASPLNSTKWMDCSVCCKSMYFNEKQFVIQHNRNKWSGETGGIFCSKSCAEFGLLQVM